MGNADKPHYLDSVLRRLEVNRNFKVSFLKLQFSGQVGGAPMDEQNSPKRGYVHTLQSMSEDLDSETSPHSLAFDSSPSPCIPSPNRAQPTTLEPSTASHLVEKNEKMDTRNGSDTCAPKRQRLQMEREELLNVEKSKVLRVACNKGPAGYVYLCRVCNRKFNIRLRCVGHAQKCGQENQVRRRQKSLRKKKCNICEFVAMTNIQLTMHRKREHGAVLRRHRCSRCTKIFHSTKSYVRHIRRHASAAVLYPCPEKGCNKRYSTKANVKRHQRKHLKSPPDLESTRADVHALQLPPSSTAADHLLHPLPIESSLPPVLQQRNQNIRDLWNHGFDNLWKSSGKGPCRFRWAMNIFSKKLIIPPNPRPSSVPNTRSDVHALQPPTAQVLPAECTSGPPTAGILLEDGPGPSAPSPSTSLSVTPSPHSSATLSTSGPSTPTSSLPPASHPSETIPPVAATQDRKRKRNGISCALCLNYSNDNAHLKQHMKSMHTPRKGGLKTDVFFS